MLLSVLSSCWCWQCSRCEVTSKTATTCRWRSPASTGTSSISYAVFCLLISTLLGIANGQGLLSKDLLDELRLADGSARAHLGAWLRQLRSFQFSHRVGHRFHQDNPDRPFLHAHQRQQPAPPSRRGDRIALAISHAPAHSG